MLVRASDGSVVVRSRYVRGQTTAVFAAFALLGAGGFADPAGTASLVFTGVMELLLGVLIVRAWRSATMIVDEKEVVVRSLVRTRRWPRVMVREFVAATRPVGMGGWRRRVLGIVFVDGTTRWLTEINSRPPSNGAPTWVDEAVSTLTRVADA
jgi:hypothetical protein